MPRRSNRLGFTAHRYANPSRLTAPLAIPAPAGPGSIPVKRGPGRPRKPKPISIEPVRVTRNVPEFLPMATPPWELLAAVPPLPDRAPTPFGSADSRRLCHHFLMTHPVQFRRYMIPKISVRGYWHRYAWTPAILGLHQGDTVVMAGRASGKSFSVLEPELVEFALTHPGEESMLTTLRKMHIVDRMERVIEYFETPTLRRFVKRIVRSPMYLVQLVNGHMLYGISCGDDPEAKMVQGKHVTLLVIEEGHQYPMRAWTKIQGAKDARGCRVLMIGVPDGRTDTPFRLADSRYPTFSGRRFRISRRWDPHFTQAQKATMAISLGGEHGDLFQQEVDALWGNPSWSAWDLEKLYKCMALDAEPSVIVIPWPLYRDQGWTHVEAFESVPAFPGRVADSLIAADIGYSQPTEIGVFYRMLDRTGELTPWILHCRIELKDKFEHDIQAELLWHLAQRLGAVSIGIDTTEGEGRAIAAELDRRAERPWVTRISFTETVFAGIREDDEGQPVEIYEQMKPHGTLLLRHAFSERLFLMPRDDQVIAEFNTEKELKTQGGQVLVRTPNTVHIPDMFRVAVLTLFLRPTENNAEPGFVLPEVGVDFARAGDLT